MREVVELHREQVSPASHATRHFHHFSIPAYDEDNEPVIELGRDIGSNKTTVPPDSVLVSKLNPRIPRVWLPEIGERDHAIASTEFLVLRPTEVDRGFLKHLFLSPLMSSELVARATGTTRSHQRVRAPDILAIPVGLPPLPEQRKIAAILSSVDDAIEKTQAVIDQVQVVKRGLMQELLTRGLPGRHSRFKQTDHPADRGMTPDGWKNLPLSDLATVVGGGTPSRRQAAYWDGDVPWATPTDVTGLSGRIISETRASISNEGLARSSAKLLPPNSLLMTTRATIGACAVNRAAMATNQGFQNLVPKQSTSVEFLYYLIQYSKRRLERLAAGSTFLEVSKGAVSRFRVAVPPLPEQRKIAAILASVDDAIEKTQTVIDQVQVVKRGLMQELLTRGLPGPGRSLRSGNLSGSWT